MREIEKMKRGLKYNFDDEEISAMKINAMLQARRYNLCEDVYAQNELLGEILGSVGENSIIIAPFHFDNGKNIHIGSNFMANFNLTVLDCAEVSIGDNVMIGPNVLITAAGHPLSPRERRQHLAQASEIHIGDDVWIGGNVTVLPGVNIGNNVVIGAGAVVTRDIPDNSLALGVPARVVRELENDVCE